MIKLQVMKWINPKSSKISIFGALLAQEFECLQNLVTDHLIILLDHCKCSICYIRKKWSLASFTGQFFR